MEEKKKRDKPRVKQRPQKEGTWSKFHRGLLVELASDHFSGGYNSKGLELWWEIGRWDSWEEELRLCPVGIGEPQSCFNEGGTC